MTATRTFGRRKPVIIPPPDPVVTQPVGVSAVVEDVTAAAPSPIEAGNPGAQLTEAPDIDEDLRAWQRERLKSLPSRLPLRQLSLMASLCFGVASFVLPDNVNEAADWLLYVLTVASVIAWLSTWVKRKSTSQAVS